MAAAEYKIIVEQGATFGRTLLFGAGPIFNITAFSDAGGGFITVEAEGHTLVDGNSAKIVAFDSDSSVSYTGSFVIANVVAGVSFTITATWQGTITGTAQKSRDLTGKGFRAQGRATYDSETVLVDFPSVVTEEVGGVVVLSISAVVTAAYTPIDHAVYTGELFSIADETDVERSLEGKMVITAEGV